MTLRTRLALVVGVVVALAVIGGAYAAYVSTARELRAEVDQFLVDRVRRFADTPRAGIDQLTQAGRPPPGEAGAALVDFDVVAQVIDADGAVVASVDGQPTLPVDAVDVEVAAGGRARTTRDVTVDGVEYRMITAPVRGRQAVQVARPLTETRAVLESLRNRLVVLAVGWAAVAAVAAWFVARRTARPIERLTAASEHVAATQDLSVPVPVEGSDEVGRLARSFNTMLDALDTSRRQQHRLVMDASHELRTPLTAVRTNVDLLLRAHQLDPAERRELLDETRLELVELTDLVTELVELATDARSEEPVVAVDLVEVAHAVAERFARRSGRPVEVSVTEDGVAAHVVRGRRSMIERAVSNLVDNALKFSDAPAGVEVEVAPARVRVLDRGPGVEPDDRDRVFDRFTRAESARTRPGSGLGLAIVAQIAELHGGRAHLEPRPGGGTVAVLALGTGPVEEPDAS